MSGQQRQGLMRFNPIRMFKSKSQSESADPSESTAPSVYAAPVYEEINQLQSKLQQKFKNPVDNKPETSDFVGLKKSLDTYVDNLSNDIINKFNEQYPGQTGGAKKILVRNIKNNMRKSPRKSPRNRMRGGWAPVGASSTQGLMYNTQGLITPMSDSQFMNSVISNSSTPAIYYTPSGFDPTGSINIQDGNSLVQNFETLGGGRRKRSSSPKRKTKKSPRRRSASPKRKTKKSPRRKH